MTQRCVLGLFLVLVLALAGCGAGDDGGDGRDVREDEPEAPTSMTTTPDRGDGEDGEDEPGAPTSMTTTTTPDEERLPAPSFDLSGDWRITDANCFGDFSDSALDVLEDELLAGDPALYQQSGNELEITSRDSGRRIFGTITGDQVRFADEQHILDYDILLEAEGTAFSRDLVVLTSVYEFRTGLQTSEVICESDRERVMEVVEEVPAAVIDVAIAAQAAAEAEAAEEAEVTRALAATIEAQEAAEAGEAAEEEEEEEASQ